jgi:hypothetical protein
MSTVSVDERSRSPRVAKVNASSAVRGVVPVHRVRLGHAQVRPLDDGLAEPVRGAVLHRSPELGRKSACVAQSVTKQHLAPSDSGTSVPTRRQRISPLAPCKRGTNTMANTDRYDPPCPRAYSDNVTPSF